MQGQKFKTKYWAQEFEDLDDAITYINVLMQDKFNCYPMIKKIDKSKYFANLIWTENL